MLSAIATNTFTLASNHRHSSRKIPTNLYIIISNCNFRLASHLTDRQRSSLAPIQPNQQATSKQETNVPAVQPTSDKEEPHLIPHDPIESQFWSRCPIRPPSIFSHTTLLLLTKHNAFPRQTHRYFQARHSTAVQRYSIDSLGDAAACGEECAGDSDDAYADEVEGGRGGEELFDAALSL
jgi:hypothetical protein